jgi:hypothetical protein
VHTHCCYSWLLGLFCLTLVERLLVWLFWFEFTTRSWTTNITLIIKDNNTLHKSWINKWHNLNTITSRIWGTKWKTRIDRIPINPWKPCNCKSHCSHQCWLNTAPAVPISSSQAWLVIDEGILRFNLTYLNGQPRLQPLLRFNLQKNVHDGSRISSADFSK